MSPSPAPRSVAAAAAGCALAAALTSACSATQPRDVAADGATQRVMVKLVRGSDDAAAISAEATRIAGVRVSYAAASSAQWHALALHCASVAECGDAIARLRGAADVYQAVEIDGRKSRSAS